MPEMLTCPGRLRTHVRNQKDKETDIMYGGSNLDWTESGTHSFDQAQLNTLRDSTAAQLISTLRGYQSLYVLRALAELLLHGETDKLRQVAADPAIDQKWRNVSGAYGGDMISWSALRQFLG